MNRVLCRAVLVMILGTTAGAATAGVPDPSLSSIPAVLSAPGGASYCLTIVGAAGPITAANVELRYSAGADTAACWCSTQVHPILAAVTDGSGVACFAVSGGGCIDPVVSGFSVDVYVNDIFLKSVGQRSPDVVQTSTDCAVGLADAVDFTPPLATATFSFCYDLVEDGVVGLADAVAFTPYAAGGTACP